MEAIQWMLGLLAVMMLGLYWALYRLHGQVTELRKCGQGQCSNMKKHKRWHLLRDGSPAGIETQD